METERYTVTTLSTKELCDLLREPMRACGHNVDWLYFNVRNLEIVRVASGYDLSSPPVGTLEDLIREEPPLQDGNVPAFVLASYLAVLTDEGLYGEKALPKTDYRVTDS